ncbi:MAG: sulfite exporter TauE/SafE family protein, partial [Stellaceae bacterium]
TFPALVFAGVPALSANASSAVALFPGNLTSAWAFRNEIRDIDVIDVRLYAVLSLVGSLLGAVLLLETPSSIFEGLVPWLMLFATIVFAIGNFTPLDKLKHLRLGRRTATVAMFLMAIYGGYFGAGLGFMMLATLTLLGMRDILAMNGLKLVLAALMSVTSVVTYTLAGIVDWSAAVPVLAGALAGGYLGAHGARRLNPGLLKGFIVALGVVLTVFFFWHGA